MTTGIHLKQIEEKTRASYFEDGFWDIGVGLAVLAIGLLVSLWFSAGEVAPWWWHFLPPAIIATPAIARRYITYPRMGQVKLRWMPSGNLRGKLLYVFCVAVAFLFAFGGLFWYAIIERPDATAGVVAGTGWLLFFGTFGHFWRYRLTYAYGLLVAVSAALAISIDNPAGVIMMCGSGGLMVVIGLARTIRFLRKYPRASVEDVDANRPT